MKDIGIDVNGLLEQLAGGSTVAEADHDDITASDPELGFSDETDEIHTVVSKLVDDAVDAGFDSSLAGDLRALVHEYEDVCRLKIGADEPVKVEPMRVALRPDSEPYRSGVRKYPDMQRAFLRTYVQELLDNGLIVRNNNSRWACAALPVRKSGGDGYRITVDYRPVNKMTVPLAGATPNLAAVTQSVRGAYGFGQFDLFQGFWQMPFAVESQELFSFVTEDGVFTPLRVPQGASDSAMFFQLQMHDCFRAMLYDSVLILCQRNLKLNAKKCTLSAHRVVWCGKVIDGEGLEHDPARLSALREMPLPPTAAALQSSLCAVNWLRDSMVDYACTVGPLQDKLEKVMAARGRRKAQLAGVDLTWTKEDEVAFQLVIELLGMSTKQYFADSEAQVCLFSDASARGWSIILTQVAEWNDDLPVTGQAHQMLICRGGLFKGAQVNWSTVEQEAYPIVWACGDLAYLLEREQGVRIYCDHANLIKIFAPGKEVKQHVRGKLQRWALKMIGIRYEIEHIKGEDNLWADIVSRWGQPAPAPSESPVALKRVTTRSVQPLSSLRPLQDAAFQWPSLDAVRQEQQRYRNAAPVAAYDDGLFRHDGNIWIPGDAKELLQRILIVAHCGQQGHCGADVMLSSVQQRFSTGDGGTGRTSACNPEVRPSVHALDQWDCVASTPGHIASASGHAAGTTTQHTQLAVLVAYYQANLNHTAVESLGGHAPVELFAGLLAASPLDCVVVPNGRTPRVLSLGLERLSEQLDNLRAHFREMHAEVVERKRLANMARSKGSTCNFEPGDYVLWSRVDKRLQSSKLLVRWVGPFRVTEALAHSFMVEYLLTKDVYE
ncbi:unnamed protein product [Phytophthora fragariaefolia]|uniref:Unnamed protein product n=1 Tax=Phytophthora fragariaefolia TaxID=1490495 RepID=A0A9W6YB21_9STRA|nr:unnamed protein product [Phytophthora fragariaefolia]